MAPAVDRISNLPKNVTETILMYLPLRDAVRTSILSRYWRYEWNTLPQLLFDEKCLLLSKDDLKRVSDRKLVEIVDQVLLRHHGPIRKFKLSFSLMRSVDIDGWILFLSRNGIKEFILNKWNGEYYKVSSCLYLCEEITYLELRCCTIALPASFKGFSCLTTLDLKDVDFCNNGLESLISACPLLKKLVLKYISGCDHLNICAMKLVDLELHISFEDLSFQNTPLVAILSINIDIDEDPVVSDGAVCKLIQVFGSLPRIERLELHDRTLSILSRGNFPIKLPRACLLNYLSINLNFEDMQEMLAALFIFKSSPILQKLSIEASSDENTSTVIVDNFWEAEVYFNRLFTHLRVIELTNFTATKSELQFLEFVLAIAPVLETAQITLEVEMDDEVYILREITRFRRVSSKAEIVC